MSADETLKHLRIVQSKYENKTTATGEVRISDLARDAADTIEELLKTIAHLEGIPNI